MTKADEQFMALARARYDQAEDADKKQLDREISDLRFYNDEQWPEYLIDSRKGGTGVPQRPALVINKLRDPIRHVEAEAQQTDLGPSITPADDFTGLTGPIDETEIELREGLTRKIQRDSGASDARNWAAQRARITGRGFYVVMTRYCSNRSNDQEVYVSRLYNQNSARLDPSHEQPDGSDAEWGFYGTTMTWSAYKAAHPERASRKKSETDSADRDEWRGLGNEAPDWFTGEVSDDGKKDTRHVRVMNYFFTERESVTLVELQDGRMVPEDELPKGAKVAKGEDGKRIERPDVTKTIKWAKIDGAQKLDETTWDSPYIPIVKVVGEELQPYDDERRYQGMVRPARDSQFGFNAMATTEVEVAMMLPKTPIVGYFGQFEGLGAAWDQAHFKNIGRVEAKAFTEEYPNAGGNAPLPLPGPLQRSHDIGVFDGIRSMFDQGIRATTGTPDSTLGNVDPSVRSGRAVKALQDSARQGTSGYLANLVKSVTYEGRIINSLLEPIYGRRTGRLIQMMTGKNESQAVLVGKPFVRDAQQRPMPVDPAKPPVEGQPAPKEYKLTKGATFNVAIRVSKNYDKRREELSSELGELIGANPVLMTWFGDLYIGAQDWPEHKEMAERAKVMLDPKILASLNKDAQQIPPEVQAQMQSMQGQLQQAMQFINTKQAENQGKVETEKIKAQTDFQIEQLKAQLELKKMEHERILKQMDNAAKIEVARIGAAKESSNIAQEAAEERLSTGLAMQHDREMAVHQAAVGQQEQSGDQSHQERMAERGQMAQSSEAEASRLHEQQMAQQAAEQASFNGGGDE